MRDGIQAPESRISGWMASPAQLAAAQAAISAQKDGKEITPVMLEAAKKAATVISNQQQEQNLTRRYLLALTNRQNMAGKYAELSTIELLDIVTSTSFEGGALTFEQYKAELVKIEQQTQG